MSLTTLGWAVVFSLWQCTFVAGLTALVLGLLPDARTRLRYRIACVSLAIMAIAPVLTAVVGGGRVGARLHFEVAYALDATVGYPDVVPWALVALPWVGGIWSAGLLLSLARVVAGLRRVRRLRTEGVVNPGTSVQATFAELRTEMALRVPVAVQCSEAAAVPMVVGVRRPIILLPIASAGTLAPPELRAVLAHELEHVRRGDFAANVLQVAAETLLFHHPAARWVSRRIRTEREYCCDDVAVAIGRGVGIYARALASLEDARDDCRLVVAAASGTLLDRIQRIAGRPRPTLTAARGAVAMLVASVVTTVLLVVTLMVPPILVPGMKLRRRTPPPAGVVVPAPDSLPRLPRTR